ncbi:MAG TPA: ABC transporter permease [Armatimonadaceae bacterium]|nr:ABC transporter permease [Armatimonadaceae bacterium]
MSFLESIRVALTALRANKLRSLLTMLGVIIGVGSVIIMISIVQGARQRVIKEFRGSGSDIVFAFYAPKRETVRGGKFEGLKRDDVIDLERRATLLENISPRLETSGQASRGKKTYSASLVGVAANYREVAVIELERGRFVEAEDLDAWAKVCILGDKVRTELFAEGEDPIGQTVVIQVGGFRTPLTVVGLLKRKGNEGFGPNPDEQIILPLTTVQKRLTGSDRLAGISARAVQSGAAEAAADQMFAILKQRHPGQAQDFIVDTQEGLLKRLDSVLLIFQLILGGVGGLSLLVGGIGIMNIMLVSVTERTREIGIRKAVGAKQGDVLLQFITESMTVSGVGGLLGVGFGYGISKLIGFAAGERLPTYVPMWAALLGFGFAVGVGMFFGIYPAFRAAKLDPINALRYE